MRCELGVHTRTQINLKNNVQRVHYLNFLDELDGSVMKTLSRSWETEH